MLYVKGLLKSDLELVHGKMAPIVDNEEYHFESDARNADQECTLKCISVLPRKLKHQAHRDGHAEDTFGDPEFQDEKV